MGPTPGFLVQGWPWPYPSWGQGPDGAVARGGGREARAGAHGRAGQMGGAGANPVCIIGGGAGRGQGPRQPARVAPSSLDGLHHHGAPGHSLCQVLGATPQAASHQAMKP